MIYPDVLPSHDHVSTKSSCVTEDLEKEETHTDISDRCRFFVGEVPPC